MATYLSVNRSLTTAEMQQNALAFREFMLQAGWTLNAICGMMGNIQSESRCNPGAYEGYKDWPSQGLKNKGYGMVQWTPYAKIQDWCRQNGYDFTKMESQILRFEWEIANKKQWGSTSGYNFSFAEFKKSTLSVRYLAEAFLMNYERPASGASSKPKRGNQAEEWLAFYGGNDGGNPTPTPWTPTSRKKIMYWGRYF